MASISLRLATGAVAGLLATGAMAETPARHATVPAAQQAPPASTDTTPPGTGAADLPHSPIVNGKQLQPRPSAPPTKQEAQQVNQLLQQTPPDAAANGPIVQPRDLFGNPLGGSPGLDPKKP